MHRVCRLLAPLLLTGCFVGRFSDGEPLDASLLERLEPGRSTAGDVTEILGPPQQVVDLGGRSAYQYRYGKQSSAGALLVVVGLYNQDERYDRIWVFFDEKDVLTHYGASFHAHRARPAFPWSDLQDPEKNAKRDAKRAERERAAAAQGEAEAGPEAP